MRKIITFSITLLLCMITKVQAIEIEHQDIFSSNYSENTMKKTGNIWIDRFIHEYDKYGREYTFISVDDGEFILRQLI